jgi:hypothetical protein
MPNDKSLKQFLNSDYGKLKRQPPKKELSEEEREKRLKQYAACKIKIAIPCVNVFVPEVVWTLHAEVAIWLKSKNKERGELCYCFDQFCDPDGNTTLSFKYEEDAFEFKMIYG